MKTLHNISSYFLGLLAFFMPKLTDTLETTLKQVIAKMKTDELVEQANQILYSQQQQVAMEEMDLAIKWIGVFISIAAALILYFKDIKTIHAGLHYFWVSLSCFAQATWWLIVSKLTILYFKISCLWKRVKRTLTTLFTKHTHNH